VTKIYYLELLASEGTLSCWSRLHLQSLASIPVSRRLDVRRPVVKKLPKLYHNMTKNMLYRPHLRIRVGKRKEFNNTYRCNIFTCVRQRRGVSGEVGVRSGPLCSRPIAEASQIFLGNIHVLPKGLSYEEYCKHGRW
jgi:hypothetical protein